MLFDNNAKVQEYFDEYEAASIKILDEIEKKEYQLFELKNDITSSIKSYINEYYK
jgi:hypothetical protein